MHMRMHWSPSPCQFSCLVGAVRDSSWTISWVASEESEAKSWARKRRWRRTGCLEEVGSHLQFLINMHENALVTISLLVFVFGRCGDRQLDNFVSFQ
jgi:hypothetical protein